MKVRPELPLQVPCPIALVGEAPGETEEFQGRPFVGESGKELRRMLRDAGIVESLCLFTNLLDERPGTTALKLRFALPNRANDLGCLCVSKAEAHAINPLYSLPPLAPGKYLHPNIAPGVRARLMGELAGAQPNVVVALGNTALWALTGGGGISKRRGTVTVAQIGTRAVKVIPTYHPAAVLRNWEYRVVVVADLIKALRESEFPEVRRPKRELWLDPSLEDLHEFERRFIRPDSTLSIDVETKGRQVTHFGVSPDPSRAIVVPFFDRRFPGGNYWSQPSTEMEVWKWVRHICEGPHPKVGQNFMYDLARLEAHGIRVRNFRDDTMLMHHALYSEMPKDLGFLGSIYTNEIAWKTLRIRGQSTLKKED